MRKKYIQCSPEDNYFTIKCIFQLCKILYITIQTCYYNYLFYNTLYISVFKCSLNNFHPALIELSSVTTMKVVLKLKRTKKKKRK